LSCTLATVPIALVKFAGNIIYTSNIQNLNVYAQQSMSDLNLNDDDISANQNMTNQNQNSNSINDDNLIKLYNKVDQSVVQVTYNSETPGKSRLGSGFIYDKEGHIITNYHVVAGDRLNEDFDITFIDGSTYKAEVIGADPFAEIAVLKILAQNNSQLDKKLVPLQIGNFSDVQVGQRVAAVGNPFGLSASITEGIVSGLGRLLPAFSTSDLDQFSIVQNTPTYSIPNIIQTDAAINPGNSGGPLLNMKGQVIGINTAIFSNTGAYTGVGFAIPSYLIHQVVPSLISTGTYEHPHLGISGIDVNPDIAKAMNLKNSTGFLVIQVSSESPAQQAGIRGGSILTEINGRQLELGGDIIIGVDDKNIRKIDDLLSYLEREKKVGDNITLSIIRNGQNQEIDLTLTARPNSFAFGSEVMPESQQGTNKPSLGVTGIQVTPEIASQMNIPSDIIDGGKGFLVIDVIRNGSAYEAGLRGGYISSFINGNQIELGGDIILDIDNIPIHTANDISKILSTKSIGDVLQLSIYRDTKTVDIPLTLQRGPPQQEIAEGDKMPTLPPLPLPPPSSIPRDPFPFQPFDPFSNFEDEMYGQCTQIISKEACERLFGR
ncbi:MAG: trypsin-like peptidase domain-containing protein, partial [Candidatus Nitrosocosmicus sp.]|nr:trypsin-like peptidase domain-containing protein [Candidatus Nitrosocosmicus sp.]